MKIAGKPVCKQLAIFAFLLMLLITFTGAKRCNKKPKLLPLSSIHIIDRNGLSETISNKERMQQFQNIDFLKSQPYQKVLRIYARDSKGHIRSAITTYYENGNVKQFLEILDGRANGCYWEWHENGVLSLSSHVIGGTPDITSAAEKTWLFDGVSCVWDENNRIKAEISYSQGFLEGVSIYYHSCGEMWKRIPYSKDLIEGKVEIFCKDGRLLQEINYCEGKKHGISTRYWEENALASQEVYYNGKLEQGTYFDRNGEPVAEIKNGKGQRAVFGKRHIKELQDYIHGSLEGEVKVFNEEGILKRIYHVKNGMKHGEEIEYYDQIFSTPSLQPKFSFHWTEGKIQGIMRTWYSNGNLESQKELANNAKNGVLTAWYRDGNIMMIEEYEMNKLIRGDYFKIHERTPVSQILQGKGTATLFDPSGHFIQKVNYVNGKPEL